MRTLKEIEVSIERGHKAFVQLGQDYRDIKDGNYAEAARAMGSNRNKQYREVMIEVLGYPTLEEYWKGRWDISQRHVNEIIVASETVQWLQPQLAGAIALPNSESQVRELAKAPVAQQSGVWTAAVKEAESKGRTQPTAKEVAEEVAKVVPKKSKPKMTEEQKEARRLKKQEEKALEEQMRIAEIKGSQLLAWEKVKGDFLSEFEDLLDRALDQLEESEWLPFRLALSNYITDYKRKNFRTE